MHRGAIKAYEHIISTIIFGIFNSIYLETFDITPLYQENIRTVAFVDSNFHTFLKIFWKTTQNYNILYIQYERTKK